MERELRIQIEEAILRSLIHDLLQDGYCIEVGVDGERDLVFSTDPIAIFDAATGVDETKLYVRPFGKKNVAEILLVFGNDGYDLIADYNTSLEGVLARTDEYANDIEEAYHENPQSVPDILAASEHIRNWMDERSALLKRLKNAGTASDQDDAEGAPAP